MTSFDRSLRALAEPGRFRRYVIVGVMSALGHLVLLTLFVEALKVAPTPASSCAFLVVILVAFLLQHHWVFRSEERMCRTAPRFVFVAAIAFAVNAVTLYVGSDVLSGPYLLVQTVAFVLVPLVNYVMHTLWTFTTRSEKR